ncbi:MAG: hypothetical protein M3O30_16910 [Planctomycetota bacterium]|nr:hypothetical protein [Planctomycetota bacterium]
MPVIWLVGKSRPQAPKGSMDGVKTESRANNGALPIPELANWPIPLTRLADFVASL